MQASVTLIRCTVVDGHLARDVEISAVPETETAAILAALPFDLAGRTVYCGQVPLTRDSTLAESPITPGCVLTIGTPGPSPFTIPDDAVGTLSVLAGPSAGAWAWVRTGTTTTIGRDPWSTLSCARRTSPAPTRPSRSPPSTRRGSR